MHLLSYLGAAIFCLITVSAGFAQAIDLDKIDRSIVKEPAYQSKAPKYALLVFGLQAKTRIWLVLDGTTLYVDRNGNGDLTEAGEKVTAAEGEAWWRDEELKFTVGELRDGDRRNLNITVTVSAMKPSASPGPRAMALRLYMDVDAPGYRGLGEGGRVLQKAGPSDLNGDLQFSDRPQGAPILHFGGPWTIALDGRPTFRVNREMELYVALGTPGRGKGTFVCSGYEDVIPRDVCPRVEIAFPAKKPGEPPVKMIYELKGRC